MRLLLFNYRENPVVAVQSQSEVGRRIQSAVVVVVVVVVQPLSSIGKEIQSAGFRCRVLLQLDRGIGSSP